MVLSAQCYLFWKWWFELIPPDRTHLVSRMKKKIPSYIQTINRILNWKMIYTNIWLKGKQHNHWFTSYSLSFSFRFAIHCQESLNGNIFPFFLCHHFFLSRSSLVSWWFWHFFSVVLMCVLWSCQTSLTSSLFFILDIYLFNKSSLSTLHSTCVVQTCQHCCSFDNCRPFTIHLKHVNNSSNNKN